MRTLRGTLGFVSVLGLFGLEACGGGGATISSTPPPPPPRSAAIVISSVSPNPVNSGATLTIDLSGADPSAPNNNVVSVFTQGSLPSTQGRLISSSSLGNGKYRAYYQVPSGSASDTGVLPIPTTLVLSNRDASSAATALSVTPPPTASVFPEEIYVGDVDRSVRVLGRFTHFDAQTTIVTGSSGVHVTRVAVLGSHELFVDLTATAQSHATASIEIQSGGADPKFAEVLVAPIAVASVSSSALITATKLSASNGSPGEIVNVSGLFVGPDPQHHNTLEWDIAGHSITFYPVSETSSQLTAMVPLWPNSDGSIYNGPAQLKITASGNVSVFNFKVDPLPANTQPRGAILSQLIDSLENELAATQNTLSALPATGTASQSLQAIATQTQTLISQLQQWVNAASGNSAVLPNGVVLDGTMVDLAEKLLVSSGVSIPTSSTAALRRFDSLSTNAQLTETNYAQIASFCRGTANTNDALDTLSKIIDDLAFVTAIISPPALPFVEGVSDVLMAVDVVEKMIVAECQVFPVVLTAVDFAPGSQVFANAGMPPAPFAVSGTFSGCLGSSTSELVITVVSDVLQKALDKYLDGLVDEKTISLIVSGAVSYDSGHLLEFIGDWLQKEIASLAGISLTGVIPSTVPLTSSTISLQVNNPLVAQIITGQLLVMPMGPGATLARANLSAFLLSSTGSGCKSTDDSSQVAHNEADVSVQGQPISTPVASGAVSAIVPSIVNGVAVDEAFVPLGTLQEIAVIDAAASARSSPLGLIQMPSGFVPTATAADPLSMQVLAVSSGSPLVVTIDAKALKVTQTFSLPVNHSYAFSGGSCMVCGVVVDSAYHEAIFATGNGYFVVDLQNLRTVSFILVPPAENFGYDPVTRQILSPYYTKFDTGVNAFGLESINVSDGSVRLYNGFVGDVPDAAVVDYSTGIAVIPNEPFTSSIPYGFLTFVNLNAMLQSAGSFSAPLSTYSIRDTASTCFGSSDEPNDWTMAAVDANTHSLFLANEFSNCAAVLDLPPIPSLGTPVAGATARFGSMPVSPDGQPWLNSLDPHGISVFVGVVDGRSFGFLVRQDGRYVARIDLLGFLNASPLPGTQNEVDLTPLVTFLPTLSNEP